MSHGWEQYTEVYTSQARIVLSDNDVKGRARQLERLKKNGNKLFFVYPHAARPSMINDQYPAWEHTTAQFVVNEHHADVLREYGYKKPLHGIGWYLCPLKEFSPKKEPKNILFCPIHPRNAPQDREVNRATFERLHKLVKTDDIKLTVRMIGLPEDNGLKLENDVTYTNGKLDQSLDQIDNADVVIGHQTVAWLSVARGIPTVMTAEYMPTHFRVDGQNKYQDVKSWKKVHEFFRYPLDILCEDDTMSLLTRAVKSDVEIADWRRRMIGDAFDASNFVQTIERYL